MYTFYIFRFCCLVVKLHIVITFQLCMELLNQVGEKLIGYWNNTKNKYILKMYLMKYMRTTKSELYICYF